MPVTETLPDNYKDALESALKEVVETQDAKRDYRCMSGNWCGVSDICDRSDCKTEQLLDEADDALDVARDLLCK